MTLYNLVFLLLSIKSVTGLNYENVYHKNYIMDCNNPFTVKFKMNNFSVMNRDSLYLKQESNNQVEFNMNNVFNSSEIDYSVKQIDKSIQFKITGNSFLTNNTVYLNFYFKNCTTFFRDIYLSKLYSDFNTTKIIPSKSYGLNIEYKLPRFSTLSHHKITFEKNNPYIFLVQFFVMILMVISGFIM